VRSPERERWHRHPADVARLIANLVLLGALAVLTAGAPDQLRSLSVDVIAVFENIPSGLANAFVGSVQLVAVLTPIVGGAMLVARRRLDLLALATLAATVAAVAMVLASGRVESTIPLDELGYDRIESWFVGRTFPSSTFLAAMTAVLVTAGPWMRRSWRRAGWLLLAAVTVARIVTATEVPLRIGVLLALGAAAGSATLVIFGAPRRRVDPAVVSQALATSGIPTASIELVADDRGVPTFRAVTTHPVDQRHPTVFVKVLGRDERDTDLLLSAWRRLTLRGLGDDSPRGRPQRVVENEALALAMVRSAGASAPEPLVVTSTDAEASVLATAWTDGTPLDELDELGDDVSDAVLTGLWSQVSLLQDRRLAHRALHPSNVLVSDGRATMVDLRRADLDASDEVLGADVAELLASLALQVGAERAVASAAAGLSREHLVRALPLIQLPVLSPTIRAETKRRKPLLDDVRRLTAEAAGVEAVEIAPVRRITLKGAVSLLGSVVLTLYVFQLVANWSETWAAFTSADTVYLIPIAVMAVAGFFAGALSLVGAATVELPYLQTTQVMFAQSFLNRFTPANAGGMAMRMRYLQLNGLDGTSAAAAVGLTSVASGAMQAVFIVVFFIWGGTSDRFDDFEMPDVGGILIAVLVIGAVGGAVVLSGWGRCSRSWPARSRRTDGLLFEPKWDGFRCIVFRDGDEIELASRNQKPFNRYFPELLPAARRRAPRAVRGRRRDRRPDARAAGSTSTPCSSASTRPSRGSGCSPSETPASFVAFDLLALDDRRPDRHDPVRRAAALLEEVLAPNARRCTSRRRPPTRRWPSDWFTRFEGAGLDGVMAKPLDGVYTPDKRTMVKVKHERTADCVVAGYRIHKDGEGVGSLLLGLYDDAGRLHHVGVCARVHRGVPARAARRPGAAQPLERRRARRPPVAGVGRACRRTASGADAGRLQPVERRQGPVVRAGPGRAGGRGHVRSAREAAGSATVCSSCAGAPTARPRAAATTSSTSPTPGPLRGARWAARSRGPALPPAG
jgi:tRNA A-37 threonylcarbamoyl transferase component Bud32